MENREKGITNGIDLSEKQHQKLKEFYIEIATSKGITISEERLEMIMILFNSLALCDVEEESFAQRCDIIQNVIKVKSITSLNTLHIFSKSATRV